ncbi:hypothetical protein MKQ70_12895 [Chitinophaga sedimenti]|uniref:hypothetical protein n=1 Tax=Chitinophaga sedimenti TaxID=2033606 RepID=UPI00200612A3|nr:hypothetical protein [Chitinophaga sedimenti]MCK7555864.1 hypothetical protein [Chitinophaga sedimenti]
MGTIGKQSITASIITYIGFAIGGLTTILFLNSKFFSAEQYGLTRVLFDIAYTLFGLANLGTVSILYRFYPYYRDRLPNERRDLFGRMLIVAIIGFVVVAIALFLFKGLFIQKFQGKSPLLVDYYYLIFPFTFFFLIFSLLEAQAWNERAAVATTFFKELALRFFTLLGMVLFLVGWISFDQFMLFFSCLFGLLALGLYLYLKRKRGMVITIEKSIVTRRMWKKMIPYGVFVLLITFCSIWAKPSIRF